MLAEVPLDPARLRRLPPLHATPTTKEDNCTDNNSVSGRGGFDIVGNIGEMMRLLERQGASSAGGYGCGKKCYCGNNGEMLRLLEWQGASSAGGYGCGKKCYLGDNGGREHRATTGYFFQEG
jgi:hypothetical protein